MTDARDLLSADTQDACIGLSAGHTATEGYEQDPEGQDQKKKRSLPVPRKIVENSLCSYEPVFVKRQQKDCDLAWHEWLSLMTPTQRNEVKRFCRNRYEGLQPWTVWRMMIQRGIG